MVTLSRLTLLSCTDHSKFINLQKKMEAEALKSQISALKNEINEAIEAKASSEVVEGRLNEFHKTLENANSEVAKSIANLEGQVSVLKENGMSAQKAVRKTVSGFLNEQFKDESFQKFANGEANTAQFHTKDVLFGTPDANDNRIDPASVDNTYLPILPEVNEMFRIRQTLNQGTMSGSAVPFPTVTGTAGNAGMQTEGDAKSAREKEMTLQSYPAQVLAGYVRVSKQVMDDLQGFASYLAVQLPYELYDVEDTQLLTGNGTSPNLYGLSNGASTAAAIGSPWTAKFANGTSTIWDQIIAAMATLRSLKYMPNRIIMNPQDVALLAVTKDTNDQYTAPVIWVNGTPSIYGVPINESTAVPAGTLCMFDSARVGQVFSREGLNIRFSEEDSTNFRDNMITVRAEERLAFAKFHSSACFYDTFADIATAIEVAP